MSVEAYRVSLINTVVRVFNDLTDYRFSSALPSETDSKAFTPPVLSGLPDTCLLYTSLRNKPEISQAIQQIIAIGHIAGSARQRAAHVLSTEFSRLADEFGAGPVSYTHLDVYKRQGERA